MLFVIDSNGYLYQPAQENRFNAYWPAVQSFSNGKGAISTYPSFGDPSNSNLKCTYDENYLLSCATVLANGTLSPITFAYQQYGSHYQWNTVSGPGILPTIDLYVEVVAPYPTTTASSSSSITSPSSSSTTSSSSSSISSYVAPTYTLAPGLPNSGFEDGTNQTAWTSTVDQYSTFGPARGEPYEGKWSGRVAFSRLGPNQQAVSGAYLMNTLYNLCPGFKYSISFTTLCESIESCSYSVQTTESGYVESASPSVAAGNGWVTFTDILEFTAAKSTSILQIHVETLATDQAAANIFVDDVSIALVDA